MEHRRPRGGRAVAAALTAASVALLVAGCTQPVEVAADPVAHEGGVGVEHTSADGLAVTITGRICGISGVGADKPEFTAVGHYCTVGVSVSNETGDDVNLTELKISGWSGETQYFHDYWAAEAAGGAMSTLAAGDDVSTTLFFDVPKQVVLEKVEVTSPWAGINGFEIVF